MLSAESKATLSTQHSVLSPQNRGEEDREVEAGTVVYVGVRVEHRFHSITEELRILVFFAPADGVLRTED